MASACPSFQGQRCCLRSRLQLSCGWKQCSTKVRQRNLTYCGSQYTLAVLCEIGPILSEPQGSSLISVAVRFSCRPHCSPHVTVVEYWQKEDFAVQNQEKVLPTSLTPYPIQYRRSWRCRCPCLKVYALPKYKDDVDHRMMAEEPRILRGEGHVDLRSANENMGRLVNLWSYRSQQLSEGIRTCDLLAWKVLAFRALNIPGA